MNQNNSLAPELVIPAQAGIQLIKNSRAAGQYQDFVRYAGFMFVLDSGLRRNDVGG